jgi:superfamily II DNA/RNA helicase
VIETFTDLGIPFTARLAERNIIKPTDIQKRVIPLVAAGESVLFRSATGTGKTFAYLLPMLQQLLDSPPETASAAWPLLLILAPTYELCSQIKAEADFLLKDRENSPLAASQNLPKTQYSPKTHLLIGQVSMSRQIDTLKKDKPAIVVGNTGRILQLARMGKLKFRSLRFLVLDEGDRLTADDLFGETSELIKMVQQAAARDSGPLAVSCSATLSVKSKERLMPFMGGEAKIVETEEQEILRERIEHWAIFSEGRRKISTLRSFFAAAKPKKTLVFSGRGEEAGNIVAQLQYHKISVAGLYGDMDKRNRKEAIDGFRSGKISVLVSSDLAARGLDIPGITHVIALDVGENEEAYIHRAGRTGRAGKRGVMVSIGDEEEMHRLSRLEKRLGLTVYPKELYQGKVTAPQMDEE